MKQSSWNQQAEDLEPLIIRADEEEVELFSPKQKKTI